MSPKTMATRFLEGCHSYLKQSFVYIHFPLNTLLYGLEELVEINISCPCNVNLNCHFALAMFFGTSLFIFALMFFLFRPCKQDFVCPKNENGETKKSCLKSFVNCLIPPSVWVIILFLDGDYFICGRTDWNGHYVFDVELNRSWCKPTEEMRDETELRRLTNDNLHNSRYIGYILISVLSSVLVMLVSVHDCCKTKCNSYQSCILIKYRRTDPEQGIQTQSGNEMENRSSAGWSTSKNLLSMNFLGSDRSREARVPGDVPDPETGNRRDVRLTEPTETESFNCKM